MRRSIWTLLLIVSVALSLCSFCRSDNASAKQVATQENEEFVSINITYEEGLGGDVANKIRKAVEMFPADAIQAFSNEGWKIAVLSEIADDSGDQYITAGMTNYDTKTIQVTPSNLQNGQVVDDVLTIRMVHEFGHFVDEFYGNVADTEEWIKLYATHKNDYIEYEFAGITKTESNAYDIDYATTNRYEFFACSLKDFYCHQDYLRDRYPDIYVYFVGLMS